MHSLIAELARAIMAPASQKRLLGKPYLTCWRYLGCYEQAFESGAVLGYAFSDKLSNLVQLFCDPGRREELTVALMESAKELFAETAAPESFLDLAMWSEKSRMENLWRKAGATEADIERQISSYELSPSEAFPQLQIALTAGIGFGGTFPNRTEKMWREAYELPTDSADLEMLRQAGLYVPAHAEKPLPLAE